METIILHAQKTELFVLDGESIVKGSVNNTLRVVLSDDWDGYGVFAVFRTPKQTDKKDIACLLHDGCCLIPSTVLSEVGELLIGVYGSKGETEEGTEEGTEENKVVVTPTIWASVRVIEGTSTENLGLPTDEDFDTQIIADILAYAKNAEESAKDAAGSAAEAESSANSAKKEATNANNTATELQKKAESGYFGVSPTVTVENINNGHRLTITDVNGKNTIDVMNGEAYDSVVLKKKEIGSSQFVDTLENNTITYVSVGEKNLSALWLTFHINAVTQYVQRWGLVFTVGTYDFAFYAPDNLKWAAADPVFTQGSTFRMSFEKAGDYIIGAWDEVTI